jgi:hypothetical protein
MSTTQTYLHLAGVVFPDAAQRLEDRFGRGWYRNWNPNQRTSEHMTGRERPGKRSRDRADPRFVSQLF